jgi:hypothetical protein
MTRKIDLDRIAFIGRTYYEYVHIFDLDEHTLKEAAVLDCPAGASSFTAEGRSRGHNIRACDLLYGLPHAKLMDKACADTAYALEQAHKVEDLYDWGFYGSAKAHSEERLRALMKFSGDFHRGAGSGRYIAAELPRLPFKDRSFTLVLCSHFLFLYADRLGFEFHLECIREFLRVGDELRVYPVLGLDAVRYRRLDELMHLIEKMGFTARVQRVPFEFMKGGDSMLRIART